MKKIILTNYSINNNKEYSVTLGNGCCFEFPQEKQALAFLRKTSKYLTEQLVFINNIYSRIFQSYRQNFLLFKPDSGKRQQIVLQAERTIIVNIEGIHKALEKAVWMSSSVNGNYIVFSAYYYCVNSLRSICQSLGILTQRNTLTALKYELLAYHNEINQIERSLNEYGQIKAVRMIERARYSDIETINMSKVVS